MRWLVACPRRRSSSANFRTLLHVQRNGDSGSPRVSGSINCSRSSWSVRSVCTVRLRPPPGRRTRWVDAVWGARNSANPAAIARRETPVARATRVIPPRPSAAASAAEKSRRVRSLRNGVSISNRVWMADSSSIAGAYHTQTRHCYTYFVTGSYLAMTWWQALGHSHHARALAVRRAVHLFDAAPVAEGYRLV